MPAPQMSFTIKASWFFDRPFIEQLMAKNTHRALGHAGALVRMKARQSMTYVNTPRQNYREVVTGKRTRWKESLAFWKAPSAPGTPPHAVRPHPWLRGGGGSALGVFYGFDPGRQTVVIGPNRAPRMSTNVPALHEFGGRARIRNKRRRKRRLGGAGEIRFQDGLAVYAKLMTGAQVARANHLNELLYGPMWRIVSYPPRPYMRPALASISQQLPKLWAWSVRGEVAKVA